MSEQVSKEILNRSLELCLEQFKMLSSLSNTTGIIKKQGKPLSFKKIMALETAISATFIEGVLEGLAITEAMTAARKAHPND